MKVTNYDRKGNLIKDLSKVKLPDEMAEQYTRIIFEAATKKLRDRQRVEV